MPQEGYGKRFSLKWGNGIATFKRFVLNLALFPRVQPPCQIMMQTPFLLRHARTTDIAPLQILIELSVRGLQKDDYSPAQIEGALGHTLGLDTQLIEDQT